MIISTLALCSFAAGAFITFIAGFQLGYKYEQERTHKDQT